MKLFFILSEPTVQWPFFDFSYLALSKSRSAVQAYKSIGKSAHGLDGQLEFVYQYRQLRC
jgi:hypothetical protein